MSSLKRGFTGVKTFIFLQILLLEANCAILGGICRNVVHPFI